MEVGGIWSWVRESQKTEAAVMMTSQGENRRRRAVAGLLVFGESSQRQRGREKSLRFVRYLVILHNE